MVISRENHQTDTSHHHAAAIVQWAKTRLVRPCPSQIWRLISPSKTRNSGIFGSGRHHAMGYSPNQDPTRTIRTRYFPRCPPADA